MVSRIYDYFHYGISSISVTYFVLDSIRDRMVDEMNHSSNSVWQFLAIKRRPFNGRNASSFKLGLQWTPTVWMLNTCGICVMVPWLDACWHPSLNLVLVYSDFSSFPSSAYFDSPISCFLSVCIVFKCMSLCDSKLPPLLFFFKYYGQIHCWYKLLYFQWFNLTSKQSISLSLKDICHSFFF